MISAPVVLYPMTTWVAGEDNKYYSDSLEQIISGSVPSVLESEFDDFYISIQHKIQTTYNGLTYNFTEYADTGITVGTNSNYVDDIPWSFDTAGVIDFKVGISSKIVLRAVKKSRYSGYVEDSSAEVFITVEIISEDTVEPSILSTSTLELLRSKNKMTLRVPKNSLRFSANAEFAGIDFYVSLFSGGGERGYSRMNKTAITEVDDRETKEEVLTEDTRIDSASDMTITTVKTSVQSVEYYTFTFDKDVITNLVVEGKLPSNVFLTDGETLDTSYSYFFVVTINAFDRVLDQSVSSIYSVEQEGRFVSYSLDTQGLPLRSRDSILTSITQSLINSDKKINTSGGSVFRDILDPVSLEFEKFYVIQDFVFASNAVDTLVAYDDADGDGESDPVGTSTLKRRLKDALQITTDSTLQLLIDSQFDKLASNRGLTRKGSTRSYGSATFFTKVKPQTDIIIRSGITLFAPPNSTTGANSGSFRTTGSRIIDASNSSYYYNPVEQRYEVEVEIESLYTGTSGNVPSGSIIASDALGPAIQVINESATIGGSDPETNQHLADRIKLSNISLDSGTSGGYTSTVLNVPGVEQVRVEEAGDELMLRDYDKTEKKHIGGKVDIYIKGNDTVQTVERVSFKYEYPKDVVGNNIAEQLSIVSAAEMRLKVSNNKVTSESPIVGVNSVRNATLRKDYSLAGLSIVGDGDTIILEKNSTNISIGMSTFDVIEISYKYRSSNSIVLENQPVESIVSVYDSRSNRIDPALYELVKLDDPLYRGQSSIAQDSIRFLFDSNSGVDEFISITDEEVDIVLGAPAYLNNKGVELSSIVVKSYDGTKTYIKDTDYNVILGNDVVRTEIELIPNSMIRTGSRVKVSYTASMNFRVTYRYNSLIQQAQSAVNKMKHSCADTIIKQATLNYIDLGFTIYKKDAADQATNNSLLLSRIKVAINNYLSKMKMGETLTQSRLVRIISSVDGIEDVKVPLTKMVKRNGSFVPLEDLGYVNFELYQKVSGRGVPSYISINSVLKHKTVETGGEGNLFRAIYEDSVELKPVTSPSDVSREAGSGYIQSDGKIIVSTSDGNPPQSKKYKVSYYVTYPADENVVGDIVTSEIEYIDVDESSLTNIIIEKESQVKRGQ